MLEETYKTEIVPKMMKEGGYKNPLSVPRLVKIVVNSSVSEATQNVKVLDTVAQDMAIITGQKPSIRKAKKSIAAFKLREGMPIGCMVTLRKKRMYEFFNRLVNVALPRSRDFKGLNKKGFDGAGNYTLGITEHIIFPEISSDRIEKSRGMNITIVTTAKSDKEAEALLRNMGFPLRQ